MTDCNHVKPTLVNYGESYIELSTNRTIFFVEDFTDQSCVELSAMLMYLDSIKNDLITIYINSPGGHVSGLYNVLNTIYMINSPIRTVCIGQACSAGAVLLSAGNKGERYAFSSAEIMIHGMSAPFPSFNSTIPESNSRLKFLKSHGDDIIKILAKNCNQPFSKVKKDCMIDNYMTPKEAKKYNIIDNII